MTSSSPRILLVTVLCLIKWGCGDADSRGERVVLEAGAGMGDSGEAEDSAVVDSAPPEQLPDAASADASGDELSGDPDAALESGPEPDAAGQDAGCADSRLCVDNQNRCINRTQLLRCMARDTCGAIEPCWAGGCASSAGREAACMSGEIVGVPLVAPGPKLFSSSYIILYPVQIDAPTAAVGVRVTLAAADDDEAPTRAVFGLYNGTVDAYGPRPTTLLASTGIVDLPGMASDYEFPLRDGVVNLDPLSSYWVAASYEQQRTGLSGEGSTVMFYRALPWQDGQVELVPDMSPYFSSKVENVTPVGIFVVIHAN